jgi:hypothetical protein
MAHTLPIVQSLACLLSSSADLVLACREYWPPLPAKAFFLALIRSTGLGGLALLALAVALLVTESKASLTCRRSWPPITSIALGHLARHRLTALVELALLALGRGSGQPESARFSREKAGRRDISASHAMRRTCSRCCAYAESGHAAALPIPAMNSRRRIPVSCADRQQPIAVWGAAEPGEW